MRERIRRAVLAIVRALSGPAACAAAALLCLGCHADLRAETRLAGYSRAALNLCRAATGASVTATCSSAAFCQAKSELATKAYQAHLSAVAAKTDGTALLAAAKTADADARAACAAAGVRVSAALLLGTDPPPYVPVWPSSSLYACVGGKTCPKAGATQSEKDAFDKKFHDHKDSQEKPAPQPRQAPKSVLS